MSKRGGRYDQEYQFNCAGQNIEININLIAYRTYYRGQQICLNTIHICFQFIYELKCTSISCTSIISLLKVSLKRTTELFLSCLF